MTAALLLLLAPAADPPVRPDDPISVPAPYLRVDRRADVPAETAGVLKDVAVPELGVVKAGDPVATLADDEPAVALAIAEQELATAEREAAETSARDFAAEAVAFARTAADRMEATREKNPRAVSRDELDERRRTLAEAEATLAQRTLELDIRRRAVARKKLDVRLAELELARHTLTAPLGGVVEEHLVQPGEWVEKGTPVVRVLRLDVLRAEGFADFDRVRDRLGAPAVVTYVPTNADGSDGEPVRVGGRVTFLGSEVVPTSGDVLVRATIENAELRLRPGLRVELEIGDPVPAGERPGGAPPGGDGEPGGGEPGGTE